MCLDADQRRQINLSAGYCHAAADLGHTRAEAALGLKYMKGKGEPLDLEKARYWLEKAAAKGHKVAQYQLGEFYEDGEGVPVDLNKAVHYYNLSADQHWAAAERVLGILSELGTGVPRSRPAAIVWFKRAMADGRDGLSQDLVTMLQRSDTPARFANIEELWNRLGRLRGAAVADAMGGGSGGGGASVCRNHAGQPISAVAGNCPPGYFPSH